MDDISTYLDALEQGECYRVDAVLKESALETTERVFLIVADGTQRGPFIRKRMNADSGIGQAYERLWQAQKAGKRFMHLPHILECGIDGDERVVVMEFVEGDTLADLVESPDYFDEAASIVSVLLCDAVMELHECFDPPLIHRDLKPENVIVSSTNLTLIDLGIARTFDKGAERDTRQFGTRGYAPPEQFGYGQTDERSDIYALGMLIAFCFLRVDPDRDLVERGFDDARIPETLAPVLVRATAFDPENRYGSVRAMKESAGMTAMLEEVFSDESHGGDEGVPVPPFAPEPADRSDDSASTGAAGFLAKIPLWPGDVWNAFVVLTWAVFTAASISLCFSPSESDTSASPVARVICYIGVFVIGFAFVAFGLLDKRRLNKHVPFLRKNVWWKVLLFCVVVGFAIMFVCAAAGSIMNNAVVLTP